MKLTEEQKLANKQHRTEEKALAKRQSEEDAKRNQPHVKSIAITVMWKKSVTWGYCPRATAEVKFHNGKFEKDDNFYASGCGYDKLSTVIAEIFNKYLAYKLYLPLHPIENRYNQYDDKIPYGLHNDTHKCFDGGIGIECYFDISKAIGGTFRRIANTDTVDVFEYVDGGYDENS